jgi:uncharacterized membrane protein
VTPLVIIIILISTVMHAAWNLLARGQKDELAFFRRMLLCVAVMGLVPAVAGEIATNSIPLTAWLCLVGSGVCGGVYYFTLGRAYGSSDFTVVYPVARALPVILVGVFDVLRGRVLTAGGCVGMVVVVAGCLLCPLRSFRELSLRRYLHHSIIYILLTALGTVGYTLFDKVASEALATTPAAATPASAFRYCYFFFVMSWLCYEALLALFRVKGERVGARSWRLPVLGGACTFGAYWLVLWAYQMTERVSYIVAFRQFSIVIGVVLAFAIYKERGRTVRVTGAVLITVGLIVIGLWG